VGALGSSVVDVAESLRREIVLDNQQAAQALPVMIQATQAALQRLSEAANQESQKQLTPAAFGAHMQGCMSTLKRQTHHALSKALAAMKPGDGSAEFGALVVQLQSRFAGLFAELNAHLKQQRQSSANAVQQLAALQQIASCLQQGLADVLRNLGDGEQDLVLQEVCAGLEGVGTSGAEVAASARAPATASDAAPHLAPAAEPAGGPVGPVREPTCASTAVPAGPSASAVAATGNELRRECASLLEQVEYAVLRRDPMDKSQRDALDAKYAHLSLSEEDCRELPGRLEVLGDRLFDFSVACDASAQDQIVQLQERVDAARLSLKGNTHTTRDHNHCLLITNYCSLYVVVR
jgi:hypothetical protein